MSISILSTGDEIIHGDTLNTNSRDLAQILSSENLSLGYQLSCADKETEIIDSIQFLSKDHEIIIIIGGLGPTTDDLTRFALAKWTADPLVLHKQAVKHVERRLKRANLAMNQGNLQQCLFPATAQLLPNPYGSAMGCYYQWKGKIFILLPGPPHECLPMFNDCALSLLAPIERSCKTLLKWLIYGLAESEIGQTLENALSTIDCQTGYRLDIPYIEFKVRCHPDLVSKVKDIVDPILSPHCLSSENKKASIQLHDQIIKLKQPITILDDATGGILQSLLHKPDTKNLIYFYNQHKTDLNFHLQGLEEYWLKKQPEGLTHLLIHYGNQTQEGGETHELSYRSSFIIYYAAEWLCFRLFHLINQLHQ